MTALRDALGQVHERVKGELRIVSLVPSLTELVCDLGLAGSLVGRTGFCVHPKAVLRHIPKLGGTKDVRLDALKALAPTHVIADIDENRREAVEAITQFVPHVIVVHPKSLDDNLTLYALLGGVFGRDAEAMALGGDFAVARAALAAAAVRRRREAVIYPIWRDPWMTVRRDTYIASMLAAAGWDTLPAEAARRYPCFAWDEAWVASASRILLPSEPFAFSTRDADEVARVTGKPVQRVDGEMISWYGSRAIAGMHYLTRLRDPS